MGKLFYGNHLTDDSIATILSETTGNQARVDRLIAAALEAGGKDNITVIVLTPWQSENPKKQPMT